MGASSRTFGMKSGVQPWMGCAAKAGCDACVEIKFRAPHAIDAIFSP